MVCARVKAGVFYALLSGSFLATLPASTIRATPQPCKPKDTQAANTPFLPVSLPAVGFLCSRHKTTTQTAKAAQIENSGKLALRRNTAVLPERIAPFSVRAKYSSSGQPSGRFSVPSSCSSWGGSSVSFSVLSSSCIFAGLCAPFSSVPICSSFAKRCKRFSVPSVAFPPFLLVET